MTRICCSGDSPAIFGVPSVDVTPHPAQGNQVSSAGGGALEDNPEWEYLRNILYEYMCGRQPLILAKARILCCLVALHFPFKLMLQ